MFIMSCINHRNYRMLLVPRSCAVTQTPLRIPFKSLFDSTRAAPWTGCWDTVDPKVSEKTWETHGNTTYLRAFGSYYGFSPMALTHADAFLVIFKPRCAQNAKLH